MYRLTHIEADEAVCRQVKATLAQGPLPFTVTACAAPPAEPPAEPPPDALLLGMPPGTDPEALIARCRIAFPTAPIVVLADDPNLAFAREALRAGAHDVVTKSERALAVLSRILVYAIERAISESRGRVLERAAADLARLLDALVAAPAEAVVQTDAAGTIERLSPAAAELLGLDRKTAIGTGLAEHLPWSERPRLASLFAAEGPSRPASFGVTASGAKRMIELEPMAIADRPADGPRLLKVSEIAADFAADLTPDFASSTPAPAVEVGRTERRSATLVHAGGPAQEPSRSQRRQPTPAPEGHRAPHKVARDEPAAAAAEDGGQRSLAMIEGLAQTAVWRCGQTTGGDEAFGFLAVDEGSAQTLAHLASAIAEDADLAVAVDALQITAWKTIAASAPNSLPQRLALEIHYGTAANRPHFEQLLGQVDKLPPALAEQLVLVLKGVPKGIYVPTLAKTIRAMGTARGKPALHLTELEADYRSLTLGHLALVVIDVGDLKRALAKDGKQVAALLERMRREGCLSAVRGVTGPLAEALRSRLGIDLTTAL